MAISHADPFDRLLVAQAQTDDDVVVTRNPAVQRYDIAWLWDSSRPRG